MSFALTSLLAFAGGDPVEFGRDVLPVLSELCFDCHGPDAAARKADLRLDVRDDVLFVAEPGAPDESELVARL
ncbi:MAG: c-type cytochrome domain-containing protein, partial [Planctomycetota bacterium]